MSLKTLVEKSKGEKAAMIFYLAFLGECGGMGREDPYLFKNILTLHSQMGMTDYVFNDDGSIDSHMHEETWRNFLYDIGLNPDDEDSKDESGHTTEDYLEYKDVHYDNIHELMHSDDGWFYDCSIIITLEDVLYNIFKKEK